MRSNDMLLYGWPAELWRLCVVKDVGGFDVLSKPEVAEMNWFKKILRGFSSPPSVPSAQKASPARAPAPAPQFKPSGPLSDRREELGACVDDLKGWGGLTVDFIGAKLVNQDAARVVYQTISARARQNVSGRGVVVVFGNIQAKYTAGIICPVWDTEANMRWFADTTIEGMDGRPVKLADQNREQFGWQDSPLTVYDFVVVQIAKA